MGGVHGKEQPCPAPHPQVVEVRAARARCGGRRHKKALKGKTHFKNAPMLKAVNEKDWQHDAQARRVLAIFAGENPWKDDYEMATKHARSADPESLFNCGSRRKRTWSGRAPEEAAASASETLTDLRREEEDRNVALDNFLVGIEARMNSTQETPSAAGGGGALGEDSFVATTEGTPFDSTPLTASVAAQVALWHSSQIYVGFDILAGVGKKEKEEEARRILSLSSFSWAWGSSQVKKPEKLCLHLLESYFSYLTWYD